MPHRSTLALLLLTVLLAGCVRFVDPPVSLDNTLESVGPVCDCPW